MSDAWERLLPKLEEMRDIGHAIRLLMWDQAVMMPPKGNAGRASSLATLETLYHGRLVDPAVGDLLAELDDDPSLDTTRAASVRVLRREYDRSTRVPEDLVRALATARAEAYQVWTEARPKSDFAMLEPYLAKLFELKKQEADAIGYPVERYDALLDAFEPGATTADLERLFGDLVDGLKPVADAVLDAAGDPPGFLFDEFDEDRQRAFCEQLVTQLGFDMDAGRLDTSPHPFTIMIGLNDVRQTTRTNRRQLLSSIYAALHETGHALYELGLPEELAGLPAGAVPSLGMHESQSRLWENQVGRSRPFTDYLLPELKRVFPEELGMLSPDEFHRGVNHPSHSLIRVEADEVTYNLHVVLRFRLELALFRDELSVADLPAAWNDGMEANLGLRPSNDAEGVLQDMHWAIGSMGYFPTYTIGTLNAAAIFAAARAGIDGLDDDLRAGDCTRLLAWLRDNVHAHAYLAPASELFERITGGPLTVTPFLDYLRDKYAAIYDLP
ncbi:MAG TPA: carboxypeptidase M32 [Actinomycetota bacterium]|nr:carboxypeptidase M32 [Actinomycetota bacterium]